MLAPILICCLLLVITTVVHSMAMMWALKMFRSLHRHRAFRRVRAEEAAPIAVLVIVMFLASLVESFAWALTYIWLGAIEGMGKALYFSVVTFTTLGYGDISLCEDWRLLSAFEGVNGVIMFGWSTAVIVAAVQRTYFSAEGNRDDV